MKQMKLNPLMALMVPLGIFSVPSLAYSTIGSYQRRASLSGEVSPELNRAVAEGMLGRGTHIGFSARDMRLFKPTGRMLGLTSNTHPADRMMSQTPSLELQTGGNVHELVIIDTSVPDFTSFTQDLKAGTDVRFIDKNFEGERQLQSILKEYSGLAAIHLVSHAGDGRIQLGSRILTSEDFKGGETTTLLNSALREGGDLLFYGCNLAAGQDGKEFLDVISANAGIDVAASDDFTGSASKHGDWDLEIARGDIESSRPFSESALKSFSHILPLISGGGGFVSYTGAQGGSASIDATYELSGGRGTLVFDGQSVSTNIYSYVTAGYSGNYESTLTVSMSGGQTFDVSNINTYVNTPGATYTFTPSTGTPVSTSGNGVKSLNFNDITQFTVTSTGNMYASFGEIGISDVKLPVDFNGDLTSSAGVTEPVGLSSTTDTSGEAVDLFDFTLSDGGGDGLTMDVTQLTVNVSGNSTDTERSNITWRLNGPDVNNIEGSYSSNNITFDLAAQSQNISVEDGTSETYTINAYYDDNSGLTEDHTIMLSVDGDTDLTVGGSGTQMDTTSAVTNGAGTTIDVMASQLAFITQPAGSTSGSALSTQPVVTAQDAFGNTDVDFTETVTLTEASAGTLSSTTQSAVNGVATFSGVTYAATADQESFILTANDEDGVGTDLSTVGANAVTSDVVATKLVFDTQPAPTTVSSGVATNFTTVPVVSAMDANNVVDTGYSTDITLSEVNGPGSATMSSTGDTDGSASTVSVTPSEGVTDFAGMQITYTNSSESETFNLLAASGGLTSADSTDFTSVSTPAVTDGNISISGATGTGGAFKVGDTVTATWDNTAGGDNNAGLTGVTVDFSDFGGGAAVVATDSSNTWTATYTIVSGAIDVSSGNVSVTATNNAGDTTTADTANATVDNIAPTVTDANISVSGATGTGGTFKTGDTVTATWNNTGAGDNNSDSISAATVDFSQFGGGAAVSASNSSGIWTATYTVTSGTVDGTNVNAAVTATDDAGNTTTAADTTGVSVDNLAPTVTDGQIGLSGASGSGGVFIAGDTVSATWDNTAAGDNNIDTINAVTVDFSDFGGGSAVAATQSSGTWTATYTVPSGSLDASNLNVAVTVTDNAGNATTTADTSNATVDTQVPAVSSVAVPANATYVAGQNLDFTVNTSQSITVSTGGGTPRIALDIGGSTVYASYLSGSGSSALTFRYTLQSGELDTDGMNVGALDANGGTMRDGSGNDLDTTLNSVGNTTAILVDAVDPTVSSVSVPAADQYVAGENLDFTLNASENVTINTGGGSPRIPLTVGSTTRYASYLSGSGTSSIVFRYTVQSGEEDTNGVSVAASVDANGGTLQDAAGNNLNTTLNAVADTTGVLVDAIAPAGHSVSFDDSTLNSSEAASANFTFSGAEVDTDYSYTIASSDGGTPVTGTGTVSSNGEQISGLDLRGLSDGTLTLSVTLTDSAGNSATAVTDTAELDASAPTGHSVSFDDGTLNSTEADSASFTFAAAEVGADYSYTISSSGGGTPVTDTGTVATVTDRISGLDLSGLSDGTLTLEVTLTDTSGNTATAVTDTATLDATAPDGHSVSFDKDTLNSADVGSTGFIFAGAEVGADYSYTISSAGGGTPVTGSGTIASAGEQVTGLDLSGLSDGALTLSVTLTDAAGNSATAVTDAADLDTVAPTGHSVGFDDSLLNSSEAASASFTFAGAEVGSDYSYTVSGSGGTQVTGTGTIVSTTDQIADLDLTGLDSGTVTLSVTLTDSAGNSADVVTDTTTLDTNAPTGHSVSFDDGTLNGTEAGSASFTFAAAEVGADYSYTISSSGGGTPVTGTGSVETATDQISGIDLTGLGDGTVTLSVTLTDTAGNTGTAVINTATMDASAPDGQSVSFDDDVFNGSEAGSASFTFANAEVGADFSYTIVSDSGGTPLTGSGAISSAAEQVSGLDLNSLPDGMLTLSATLTDTAGNSADEVTDTATLDTAAPAGHGISFDEADYNAAEATSVSFTFNGAEPGADFSYTIVSSGGGASVTGTGKVSVVDQQISGVDVSGLEDGTLTLSAELTDTAGNAASQVTGTAVLDATASSVALDSPAAAVINGVFDITVDFGEAVNGFGVGDLVVSNGAVSDFSGNGASYSATVTPNEDGTVTVDVNAGAAQDQAGNETTAATQLSRLYDGTAPAPVITTDVTADVTNGPIGLTVDFGETVTGFVSGDLSVTNGSVTEFIDSSNGLFELTVEAASDGEVTIEMLAGVAEDEAGNASEAVDPLVVAFDGSGPVLQGSVPAAGASDVPYQSDLALTFDEPVFAGTGELVVQDATDGVEHTRLAITDAQVSFDDAQVSITLDDVLIPTHEYYVTFAANSLEDEAGNGWAGIVNDTAFRFTVANQAPEADNDSATLDQDTRLALDVLANDLDEEGRLNPASVRVLAQPAHGRVSVETSTGAVTYEPEPGYTGPDSFTYVVEDEFGGESNAATVSLNVEPAGLPPVTRGDVATVSPGGTVTLAPLDNDRAAVSGVDLDPQSVELVLRPHHGTAQWVDGELTYTADDDFEGVESLAYTVADANGVRSAVTRLFINVADGAVAPVARDDAADTQVAVEVSLNVLANDEATGSSLASGTVELGSLPRHGVAEVDSATGRIAYTPDVDFRGEDVFHYTVRDDRGLVSDSALVTVSMGLAGVPLAGNDQVQAMDGATLAINVLGNDRGLDGALNPATLSVVDGPAKGLVTLDAGAGVFRYTPDEAFDGTDTFTYTVQDEGGQVSVPATVTVTDQPGNNRPVANDRFLALAEDGSASVSPLGNDQDLNGTLNPASLGIEQQPANGTLSLGAGGTVSYTPGENFYGEDRFTYTVEDDNGRESRLAVVRLVVAPVPDKPLISGSPTSTVTAGNAYRFTPVASDIDGNPLTFRVANLPGWAGFDENNGRISGTPELDDVGSYEEIVITASNGDETTDLAPFSVRVTDNSGGSDEGGLDEPESPVTPGPDEGADLPVVDSESPAVEVGNDQWPSYTNDQPSKARYETTFVDANGEKRSVSVTLDDPQAPLPATESPDAFGRQTLTFLQTDGSEQTLAVSPSGETTIAVFGQAGDANPASLLTSDAAELSVTALAGGDMLSKVVIENSDGGRTEMTVVQSATDGVLVSGTRYSADGDALETTAVQFDVVPADIELGADGTVSLKGEATSGSETTGVEYRVTPGGTVSAVSQYADRISMPVSSGVTVRQGGSVGMVMADGHIALEQPYPDGGAEHQAGMASDGQVQYIDGSGDTTNLPAGSILTIDGDQASTGGRDLDPDGNGLNRAGEISGSTGGQPTISRLEVTDVSNGNESVFVSPAADGDGVNASRSLSEGELSARIRLDGTSVHRLSGRDGMRDNQARSLIPGSLSLFFNDRVVNVVDENDDTLLTELLDNGEVRHEVATDGESTRAFSYLPGSSTVMERDDNGHARVVTRAAAQGRSLEATANANGSASHRLTNRLGERSEADIRVPGAFTSLNKDGNLRSRVRLEGSDVCAWVETFGNGETGTGFGTYDSDTLTCQSVERPTSLESLFEAGNRVEVESESGEHTITIETRVTRPIRF